MSRLWLGVDGLGGGEGGNRPFSSSMVRGCEWGECEEEGNRTEPEKGGGSMGMMMLQSVTTKGFRSKSATVAIPEIM